MYDPAFLHGPYEQSDQQVFGKFNQWPALATALLPFQVLVPTAAQDLVWGLLMATALIAAFALVWPRRIDPLTGIALALIVVVLPPTWLALRTANLASVVALGVAITIVGHRRSSTSLTAVGLLLAGIAKLIPAVPLVLWLLVRHRQWRPVAWASAAGAALTALPVVLQGPHILRDFVVTSAGQLPLNEWTNVAPAYRLAPLLGDLALPLSIGVALVLTVYGLGPRRSDGASLLLLTTASCLVVSTTHLFWWLAPMIVLVAYYGDWLVQRLGYLFDWRARTDQSAGAKVT